MKRFFAIAVVLAVLVAGAAEWCLAKFEAPGPAAVRGGETVVMIKPGSGLRGVTEALRDAKVIDQPLVFQLNLRFSGKAPGLKAGEYAIPSRASMRRIMELLLEGRSIQHKLTVAEGLTSRMVYELVKADPVLTGKPGVEPPEGALLPQTYLFTRGATRGEIIAKMKKGQAELLERLWARRISGLPFKSKAEALVLASIVEKETGIPAERRHIAAVFLNRLRIGMRLQSDPTIIYGITKGYPLGRRIKQSEIEAATPYNTYVIAGLPPQPICNPGEDAIAAVLNPIESKDLYFVADGSGGHVFAETVDEQARNVIRWRKIRAQQK
jgi:UPF0755 protein